MDFIFEPIVPDHIPIICDIMRECVAALPRREFFVDDPPEAIAERLDAGGFGLLARCGDEVAGFLLVDVPGEAERNLGRDLGWPVAELSRSAHVDIVCIRPAYRGHGLQKRLVADGEVEMRRRGLAHSLATVHPENIASLSSMLALGYRVAMTKEKYGGVLRHVLFKTL